MSDLTLLLGLHGLKCITILGGLVLFVSGFGLLLLTIGYSMTCSDAYMKEEFAKIKKLIPRVTIIFLFAFPFALIPSPEDLFNLRIALIKLQLASPENVTKGVETIKRIGQKLEEKYLGKSAVDKREKD